MRIQPACNPIGNQSELVCNRASAKIQPIKKAEWKTLKTDCAGRVGSLIDLLQGKLSAQVMETMTRRETGLFPRPVEIGLSCSCPDWAGMCKHVAATLYAVGVRLDESPELLFALRGADHFELVTEATKSVTSHASTPTDGSATLTGENLEEIFGIEIEPAVLPAKPVPISKLPGSRTPKQTAVGSRSKGAKTADSRNAKPIPAGKAPRGNKRPKQPPRNP